MASPAFGSTSMDVHLKTFEATEKPGSEGPPAIVEPEVKSTLPVLVVDDYNVLHLRFSHWGALPFIDNFYMTLREGEWSEPVVLFPGHPSRTAAFMTVDGSNRLHAVWMKVEEPALYHARFE